MIISGRQIKRGEVTIFFYLRFLLKLSSCSRKRKHLSAGRNSPPVFEKLNRSSFNQRFLQICMQSIYAEDQRGALIMMCHCRIFQTYREIFFRFTINVVHGIEEEGRLGIYMACLVCQIIRSTSQSNNILYESDIL